MKFPSFQFYPSDFTSSTIAMSAEQVGAYIRLLSYQWILDGIPAHMPTLMRLSGTTQAVVESLLDKFPLDDQGLRRNPRLEDLREERKSFVERQRDNANKRWNNAKPYAVALPSHMPEGMPNGMPERCSPSPSPSPSPSSNSKEHMGANAPKPRVRFEKPTIESVRLAMAKAGMPESEAEKFMNYYEANGWRVGRNPMRSWPHAVGNWKSNYEARRAPKPAATIWETKQVIEAKQAQANKLKAMHAVEGPLTTEWSDERKRAEFVALRKDIKQLTERISTAQ